MRVVRLHAPGDLRQHDEPEPVPAQGEELVRVTAVGLCGSDRHWFAEGGIGDTGLPGPLVLGHEITGIVESGTRAGLRVVLDPTDPCGHCDLCREGRSNLCRDMRFAGYGGTDGGLRTLTAWPEHLLHPLPQRIGDDEGVLLEPLGVALHALALGEVRTGMAVAVHGCGPIGLLLIQLLRDLGCAPIVTTDPLAHRAAAARAMGATDALVVDPEADIPTSQKAVDVAFEVAGEDSAVASALHSARPGGRVVLVGIPSHDRTSFPASVARRKGLWLVLCRRMRTSDLRDALRLVDEGRINLAPLITERYPLDDAHSAFVSLVEHRGLKTVVGPWRTG